MIPRYVSIKEAAEILSVSEVTIRRRISSGDLPAYMIGGPRRRRRPIRIRLQDLEAMLHRIPAAWGDR